MKNYTLSQFLKDWEAVGKPMTEEWIYKFAGETSCTNCDEVLLCKDCEITLDTCSELLEAHSDLEDIKYGRLVSG